MSTGQWIASAILFFIVAVCAVIAIRSYRQKGLLLNNAFLHASKKEREEMDKAPYYRQTAVVFSLLACNFLSQGIYALTYKRFFSIMGNVLLLFAIVYAVNSTKAIEEEKRSRETRQEPKDDENGH